MISRGASRRRRRGTTAPPALPPDPPASGYFIATNGLDANSGTSVGEPWLTLGKARDSVPDTAPATVYLRAGTYLNFTATNKNRANLLTFKPYPGEAVTIEGYSDGGTSGNENRRSLYFSNSSRFRFEGFLITHGSYARDSDNLQFVGNEFTGMPLAGYSGITNMFRECQDILHQGNHFHMYRGGARMLGSTGNVGEDGMTRWTIRANEFSDAEFDACTPYWGTVDLVVEDNYVHDIINVPGSGLHTDGIQIAPQSEGGLRTIVRRNLVLRCHQGLFIKDGLQTGLIFENNVVMERASVATACSIYNAPGAIVVNNTLATLYFRATTGYAASTNVIMENNVVAGTLQKFTDNPVSSATTFASDKNNLAVTYSGFTKDASDITGSATFINAGASDYRLANGSLGHNSGFASAYTPTVDRNGNPRPVGTVDRGGYERQAGDP